MSDKKFELSRRNALIGLGTVGVASAGAGVGTSAFFSDTEELANNTIQAGELNVKANFEGSVDQGQASPSNTSIDNSSVADGNVVSAAYQIADAKPGDSGSFGVTVCVEENPAYAFVAGELTDTSENEYTEPEPVDNNGEGELEEAINVTSVDNVLGHNNSTDVTLSHFLDSISDGIQIDGGESSDAIADGNCQEVTVHWEIPTTVGNGIQSDSLEFSLAVGAVQERHNSDPNGTSPLNSS